jgi:hypothetical protein
MVSPNRLTPDERDEYEERAAIMQYMGGMPREAAEKAAYSRVIAKRQYKKERTK